MIRVSAIICAMAVLAAPIGLSLPSTASTGPDLDRSQGGHGIRIGLGLDIEPTRVSLDGFFVYNGDPATGETTADRHTVELLAAPDAGDSIHLFLAMGRVMRSVVRSAARQWWQEYSSSRGGERG